MIDLAGEIKKGNKKLEKAVATYLMERRDTYEKSNCKIKLKKRYEKLFATTNMNFGSNSRNTSSNQFTSKLAFPLVMEMYRMWRAMIKRNFRGEPLITLAPIDNTPLPNAINAQSILTLNLKSTGFRESRSGWDAIVDDVARYGTAVSCSRYEPTTKTIRKTIDTEFGVQQQEIPISKKNVVNRRIHILNYSQNPDCYDPELSDWKAIVESIPLSTQISNYNSNPSLYVQDNIQSIIKDSKAEMYKDQYKFVEDKSFNDYGKAGLDRVAFFAKIHINGNEDDDNKYYVEMIGDKIIRIERNWIDEDEDYFTVYTMRNRFEYWWGNAPCEDVIPHENWMQLVMNLQADNVIKAMEKYIFYYRDALDPSDIDARHTSGGFIPVNRKDSLQLQNMIYDMSPKGTDLQSLDFMTREIKESAQKQSPKPDFLRSGNKGGLANNTATAAGMLGEMSDLMESDCMEVLAGNVARMGKLNILQLQNVLGNQINIRPNPKLPPEMLYKRDILGDFWYSVMSSLHKNTIQEAIRLQNAATQMINFKNTGNPEFQNLNIGAVVRKWVNQLDIGDVDEIMPEQQMQQPMMQGMPQQGAPMQDMGGVAQPEQLSGMMQ
jgi:hypothetical protein